MAGEKVTTFKIYVGNVPEGATSDEIRQIFEEFGTVVECDCLGNRAFVHMEDDIEGKHAVGQLQDRELQGAKLKILESKNNIPPKTPAVKLLVKNVSSSVDARGLRNMFKRFGFVLEVELLNGEGHVCLEATGDIGSAIKEMNGKVIDDVALTVEPAPIIAPTPTPAPVEEPFSPVKKKFKPQRNYNNGDNNSSYNDYQHQSQWSDASGYEPEWYNDDYSNYSESYSREQYFPPPRPRFHAPPERILRDPHAHQQHFRGNPRFRGRHPMAMGSRGAPRPPPIFRPPQGPRMGGMVPLMRPQRPIRGHFPAYGGPSRADNSFYTQSTEVVARNDPSLIRINVKVFLLRKNEYFRRGQAGKRGGGGARGRGGGKPQKFTALKEEVSPGEKYPVPPVYNPNFRAPMKWQKDGPKRKVKKKKKPLVPAELPDYSLPVPDLPKDTVPKGAILKPFPTPFENNGFGSQFDNANAGASGSANFSQHNEMDFTTDDIV
ncbi:RNA-binding protein lark [Orchesella cincta]|uniref:RNA-binding protein lark n=1 Tax=Orchesella cincta TaxID=48709 RepID=A0A1D2MWK2_ORCCI|nr:RNA-binding protein lark [Orchesella cincta]